MVHLEERAEEREQYDKFLEVQAYMQNTKIIKHKSTIAPFECSHCGAIWYGWNGEHRVILEGMVLCIACTVALEGYLDKHHRDLYQQLFSKENTAIHEYAREWITNTSNKPSRRPVQRRFSSSVPKWMRSAIEAGMVKTNGNEVYVVYSEGQHAIKANIGLTHYSK